MKMKDGSFHVNSLLDPPFQKKAGKAVKKTAASVFRIIILLSIGYVIIYPLLYMAVTSLKSDAAYYNTARIWFPSSLDPKFSYSLASKAINYWTSLKSTLIYEMVSAFLEVCSCAVVAYGFARFKFKSKGFWMACLFITILIPETMVIIPRMVNYAKVDFLGLLGILKHLTGIDLRINLIGTAAAFYIPSIFAIGLRSGILTYIYIQFFKSLPYELEEAAWVDGAGPVKTFFSIALPSSTVVFTTVIVFSVVWHWNDSFLSSMYLLRDFPLAVSLDRIMTTLSAFGYYGSRPITMSVLMAACIMFIAPILLMYMILQRRFIESIDRVGITG